MLSQQCKIERYCYFVFPSFQITLLLVTRCENDVSNLKCKSNKRTLFVDTMNTVDLFLHLNRIRERRTIHYLAPFHPQTQFDTFAGHLQKFENSSTQFFFRIIKNTNKRKAHWARSKLLKNHQTCLQSFRNFVLFWGFARLCSIQ